jgi:hypothetical protein
MERTILLLLRAVPQPNIPHMAALLHRPPAPTPPHPTRNPTLIKQMINVLQLQLVRLGEKRIHHRHPQRIEARKDKGPPANIANGDRRDLHHGKDAHPVDEASERLALAPDARRGYFGGVEPRDRQEADAEEDLEQKDHRRGAVRGARRPRGEQAGGDGKAGCEAGGGEHEQGATAEAVHGSQRDAAADEIGEGSAAAEDEAEVAREVHGVGVDDGGVVVDHVAAGELLHDVDSAAEDDAAEVL